MRAALAAEALERVERIDERLLRDVLGVGAAAEHAERHRERQPLIAVDQRSEGLDLTRQAARDEPALLGVAGAGHRREQGPEGRRNPSDDRAAVVGIERDGSRSGRRTAGMLPGSHGRNLSAKSWKMGELY